MTNLLFGNSKTYVHMIFLMGKEEVKKISVSFDRILLYFPHFNVTERRSVKALELALSVAAGKTVPAV